MYISFLEDKNEKLYNPIICKYNNVEEIEILFFDLVVNINRLISMKHREISYNDGILKL